MGRTAYAEPQCLYKGALYLTLLTICVVHLEINLWPLINFIVERYNLKSEFSYKFEWKSRIHYVTEYAEQFSDWYSHREVDTHEIQNIVSRTSNRGTVQKSV